MDAERLEALPDDLRDWLDERAEATGRSREELLVRAVAAYRLATGAGTAAGESDENGLEAGSGSGADSGPGIESEFESGSGSDSEPDSADSELATADGRAPLAALSALDAGARGGPDGADPERVAELAGTVESLRAETAELSAAVDDLDAELAAAVEDVRDRVLEVLAEAESKADAGHGHPALDDRIEAAERAAGAATADLSAVEDRLAGLGDEVDAHAGTLADVEGKLTTVARAVVRLRSRVAELEGENARRAAVESIARDAAEHGIRRAACDDCGRTVDVGLLTGPRCPGCGRHAETVEPAAGLFGSDRLVTADPPAIEDDPSAGPGDGDRDDVSLLATDAADAGSGGGDGEGDGRNGGSAGPAGDDRATGGDGTDG